MASLKTMKTTVLVLGAALLAAVLGPATPACAAPLWGACPAGPTPLDPRQQCATIQVPLDYANPAGPTIPRTRSPGPARTRPN